MKAISQAVTTVFALAVLVVVFITMMHTMMSTYNTLSRVPRIDGSIECRGCHLVSPGLWECNLTVYLRHRGGDPLIFTGDYEILMPNGLKIPSNYTEETVYAGNGLADMKFLPGEEGYLDISWTTRNPRYILKPNTTYIISVYFDKGYWNGYFTTPSSVVLSYLSVSPGCHCGHRTLIVLDPETGNYYGVYETPGFKINLSGTATAMKSEVFYVPHRRWDRIAIGPFLVYSNDPPGSRRVLAIYGLGCRRTIVYLDEIPGNVVNDKVVFWESGWAGFYSHCPDDWGDLVLRIVTFRNSSIRIYTPSVYRRGCRRSVFSAVVVGYRASSPGELLGKLCCSKVRGYIIYRGYYYDVLNGKYTCSIDVWLRKTSLSRLMYRRLIMSPV